MKLTNLVPFAFVGLAVTVSCSQGNLQDPSTGGTGATTSGASGSGQVMTGGAGGTTGGTGAGGGISTGGTGGSTGGTTGGTGGTPPATGGTTGGTVSMGGMGASAGTGIVGAGMGGTGSSVGGSAGTGTGGGSGGAPAGAGMGGSAGTSAGGMGAGGMGMAGGGALDPNTLIPGLDGWYWEISATNGDNPGGNNYYLNDSTQQCPQTTSWLTTGVTREKSFKMMGTAGTKYTITFELRGAMGFRCYTGGTTTQMQPNPTGVNNGWYVGGQQANNSIWNTYELDVQNPSVTGEANTYFLNGVPYSSTAGVCDQELTYDMHTSGKFVVMGDSTLRFWTHDANCKAQQDCGATPSTACVARTIDLSGMTPAATVVHQPVANTLGANTFYPQWFYFDVKSITSP